MMRLVKFGLLGLVGTVLLGCLLFGGSLISYLQTSTRQVRRHVDHAVPMEFQLQRARDMVDNILPELEANIYLIAHEEVEVAALKKELNAGQQRADVQRKAVARLRDQLTVQQAAYRINGHDYSREHALERLAQTFERYKQSQSILESKRQLLETRERSLAAARQMLDQSRARKIELQQRIESLAAKHRLLKAQSAETRIDIDGSQLARADKLLAQLQKRLDVAERVLEHKAELIPLDEIDLIDETDLLSEIDEHFSNRSEELSTAVTSGAVVAK